MIKIIITITIIYLDGLLVTSKHNILQPSSIILILVKSELKEKTFGQRFRLLSFAQEEKGDDIFRTTTGVGAVLQRFRVRVHRPPLFQEIYREEIRFLALRSKF